MTFDEYFKKVYGPRWEESLRPAMLVATEKTALASPFSSSEPYLLDAASLEPVHALGLEEGQSFADFCAAPGGKSLAAIFLTKGRINAHLNDSSSGRVKRLKAVMYDHLPEELVGRLRITCFDGARIGMREKGIYDRVLVDVPCSAERHHLRAGEEADWTFSSTKRLAVRQHSLLCSALDAAAPGGRVVYSTCSISPLENDGVVEKLMKSRAGQFEIIASDRERGEATKHGKVILPDRHSGHGPIYYSVLLKHEG